MNPTLTMNNDSLVNLVQAPNLSIAWARAFLRATESSKNHCESLVVAFPADETNGNLETPEIRDLLDDALEMGSMASCETVAGTIFPKSLWNPAKDRDQLFRRYDSIWPRLRSCPSNSKGTYFRRMTAYRSEPDKPPVNQLEHIIDAWKNGLRRNSAFQLALFDPRSDHSNGKYLGFPCLHQIAITPMGQPRGSAGLGVTGFYATQYLFQKAYGNYLGLHRLGQFIAHETGVPLASIKCIATDAQVGSIPTGGKFVSTFRKKLLDCLQKLEIATHE